MVAAFLVFTKSKENKLERFVLEKEFKDAFIERFGMDKTPDSDDYKTWYEELKSN